LKRICKWNPGEVSDREHESKSIGGDIHGCEDCGLSQG
jgi:hypothetical protein